MRRTARSDERGIGRGGLLFLLALAALALLVQQRGVFVSVERLDMAPTLLPGDLVFALATGFPGRPPRPGELVAFELAVDGDRRHPPDHHPGVPTRPFLARVVGGPGDVVEIDLGALTVNGDRLRADKKPDRYVDRHGRRPALWTEWLGPRQHTYTIAIGEGVAPELAPTRVEPGRYLLLGDYRSQAHDGRHFGSLARESLLGPALVVVFSRDPESGAIRWGRIGRLVN